MARDDEQTQLGSLARPQRQLDSDFRVRSLGPFQRMRPRTPAATDRRAERSAAWEMRTWMAVTAVVLVMFLALVVASVMALPRTTVDDPWRPVLQDVLKTATQVLGVGALGGLTKILLDLRRARSSARDARNLRRRDAIAALVKVSHDLDVVRSTITANRSVKTWTESTSAAVVPAWASVRDLAHDLQTWRGIGDPVFLVPTDLPLHEMSSYLWRLIEEHAEHKQRLAELQRRAEDAQGAERERLLADVWAALEGLPVLGDLLRDGDSYGAFRSTYLQTLSSMRLSLSAGT